MRFETFLVFVQAPAAKISPGHYTG